MIPIVVSNGKAYVWDVDDISTLRAQHKICGLLTGTLPHMGSQNVFLGLPLLLMPEEVVLLVNKKFAFIVDDSTSHSSPTSEQLIAWRKQHLEDIESQLLHDSELPGKQSRFADTEEAARKRLARQAKKALDAAASADDVASPWTPEQLVTEERSKPGSVNPHSLLIPSKACFNWHESQLSSYSSIADARKANVWSFPSTQQERSRCEVFADLWTQGYVMGGGIKFGGEYLIYPGDPLRYHSHYAATVVPTLKSPLFLMDIVAHGRLGTATKKVHLLCGWDEEEEEGVYFSIEWAGFG